MKKNRPSNKTPATGKETKSQVKRHRTQRAPQTGPRSTGPAGMSPSHHQRKVKLSSVSAVLKSQHSATMENSMEVPQKKKIKPRITRDPAIPLLGLYPREQKAGP